MHQKRSRVSWQPWLTKTLSSIQEKVNTTKRDIDIPTFQSHVAAFDAFQLHGSSSLDSSHEVIMILVTVSL